MPLEPEDEIPTLLDEQRGSPLLRPGQPPGPAGSGFPSRALPPGSAPAHTPGAGYPTTPARAGSDSYGITPPLAPPGPEFSRPRRIGPFEIVGELGRGGMGAVFRARHPSLGREVALKVLLAGTGASARARERFLLEGRLMAGLKHAHILSVHDVGESALGPYLVLDLVEGDSLAELSEREGGLPPDRVAEIGAKIADALNCAHEHGILHRDVKPHNILLGREGEPYLTDFGVAKLEDGQRLTKTGQAVGTPVYSAPELAVGQHNRVDRRSDVYGLGVTLYEVVTGEVPFEAESAVELIRKIATQEPRRPSLLCPLVDPDLETILLCCLEKEPEDRYESAAALASDLRRYLRGEPILARAPTLADRLGKWGRRNRGLTRALSLGALLLIVGSVSAGGLFVRGLERERALAEAAREEAVQAEARAQAEKALALEAREEAQAARERSEAKSAELARANEALAAQLERARTQMAESLDLRARLARRQYGWADAALLSASALALEDKAQRRYAFAEARREAWRGVFLGAEVRNAAWGPDGLLAIATPQGRVTLLKSPTGASLFAVDAHPAGAEVPSLAWAPSGTHLASWRVGEGVALISLVAHQGVRLVTKGRLSSVHWLADGLLTVSSQGQQSILETWTFAGALRSRLAGRGLQPLVAKSGRFYATRTRTGAAQGPRHGLVVYDAAGTKVSDLGLSEEIWKVYWSGDALVVNRDSGLSLLLAPNWQPKVLPALPAPVRANPGLAVMADPEGSGFIVYRPGNDLVLYRQNLHPVKLNDTRYVSNLSWGRQGTFAGRTRTGQVRIWRGLGLSAQTREFPLGYRGSRLALTHGDVVLSGAPGVLVVREREQRVRLVGPSVEENRAIVAPPWTPEAVVVLNQKGAHLWTPGASVDPIWTAPKRFTDLAFSEEGVLALGSEGLNELLLIGLKLPGSQANRRVPLPGPVRSLSWEGTTLATCTRAGVTLIDASSGELEAQWAAPVVPRSGAAWSPQGELLAVPCQVEGSVELRAFARSGKVVARRALPPGATYLSGSLRWSPDGRRLALLIRDRSRASLMTWELEGGGGWFLHGVLGGSYRTYGPLTPPPLAWSPKGDVIAVAGQKELLLAGAAEGEVRERLAAPEGRWVSGLVAWSPRGDRLIWGTSATGCAMVATQPLRVIKRLHALGAEWSPDGEVLATVSNRGFYLLDREGGTLRRIGRGGGFLRWAPKGDQVAYGAGTRLQVVAHGPYRGLAKEATNLVQAEFGLNLNGVQVEVAPKRD